MAKFKHGFPVSSAVMVGFLSMHNKAEKLELIRLATAMVISEVTGQDIHRIAQGFNADLELARSFTLPEHLDAPTVWAWRLEGYKIIREAAKCLKEDFHIQAQALNNVSRRRRATFAYNTTAILEAFKSKLKAERKLLEEATRLGVSN